MNIEEIIYSNNNILYTRHSLIIKKFILNQLKNNKDISKFNNCINYFYLNNDDNFIDSLNNNIILNIYLTILNDNNLCSFFNNNQIIISKSLNIFNNNILLHNNYTLQNFNLNYNILEIKNQLTNIDISNIKNSINIIDDIYNKYLFNNKFNFLNHIYNIFSDISRINLNQINKQIKINQIFIEKIYFLVFNEYKSVYDISEIYDDFIDSINIIAIVKLKIDNLIESKNINNIDYNKTIEKILNEYPSELVDIFQIFNIDITSDFDLILLKNNIINMINIYNEINQYNTLKLDLIKFIEEYFNEYDQLIEIINNKIYYKINNLFIKFFDDIIEFIKLNDNCDEDMNNIIFELNKSIIELFIKLKNDYNYESLELQFENQQNTKEKKQIENLLNDINYLLNPSFFIKINELINYSCNINSLKNNINKINLLKDEIITHINDINIKNSESNDLIHLNEILIEFAKENKKYSDNIDDIMIKINEILKFEFPKKLI
jgi:hypothetical protein